MKGRGLGRNKRRTAVAMKRSGKSPKAVRRAATPTTRVHEECPYCGREGGPIDIDACNPQVPCHPA